MKGGQGYIKILIRNMHLFDQRENFERNILLNYSQIFAFWPYLELVSAIFYILKIPILCITLEKFIQNFVELEFWKPY